MTGHRFAVLLFGSATLLVLGPMLNPGYILTLDMAWPTELALTWRHDGFNNALPLSALLALLGTLMPAWVVQKLMLMGVFFSLFYLPYRLLPFIPHYTGRIFAGCVYALNPFVYSRMLAGQWIVLLGYALLPVLLATLVRISDHPTPSTGLRFGGALLLLGASSLHFLYLGLLISVVWLGVHIGVHITHTRFANTRMIVRSAGLGGLLFVCVSMYWMMPALLRTTPIEARFDIAHFEGFSASANELTPTLLNVAVLGGFWGEGMEWRNYFVWPQDSVVFWIAAGTLAALVLVGVYRLVQSPQTRLHGLLLIGLGIPSYLLALGAWGGFGSHSNVWLYEHVPGWAGLRDSHKIAGVLALVYALGTGVGVARLVEYLKNKPTIVHGCIPLLFCIPLVFGMYEWGGFNRQLMPAWYPTAWYQARTILDGTPTDGLVLALPWRGYYSLPFANQRIVSNVVPKFFGEDRVRAGRSVEVGTVYDQEVDPDYRTLDAFVRSATEQPVDSVAAGLRTHHIRYLLVVHNPDAPQQNSWYLPPLLADTPTSTSTATVVTSLLRVPHTTLIEGDIALYRFDDERAPIP